jgi:hypothetical protein
LGSVDVVVAAATGFDTISFRERTNYFDSSRCSGSDNPIISSGSDNPIISSGSTDPIINFRLANQK